MSEVQDMLNK
jgi:chromosome segregation ATPase